MIALRKTRALAVGLVTASLMTGVAFALASPAGASEVFGVEAFESSIEGQEHSPAIQAGSHPYAVSATIMFNHGMTEEEEAYEENGKEEEVPLGEPDFQEQRPRPLDAGEHDRAGPPSRAASEVERGRVRDLDEAGARHLEEIGRA